MIPENKRIQQLMSLLLACMLLIAAVGGKSYLDYSPIKKEVAQKSAASKSAKQDTSDEAKVSALELNAVVTPAASFDFSQHFYFVLPVVWHFIERVLLPCSYTEASHHYFSYLKKVFCHHIAINAP